jgi:hypothetical protein
VARPLIKDIEEKDRISPADIELIAWAELYPTEAETREER